MTENPEPEPANADHWAAVYAHALPSDAPGAWIRAAIDAAREDDARDDDA